MQRGQIILLYALLIPVLFLFVGVTFDLSWYYINVSRMQNAADAAVIAGAYKLIDREQSLADFNSVTFIAGYDGNKAYEISVDTSQGDETAKNYVEKNLAKEGSTWENDSIIDLWTRKKIYFDSEVLGDNDGNFESRYYRVTLEENVPHMMLNGLFSSMNAKVSSVVRINQFMKGYDFFYQMKNLAAKQSYSSFEELKDKDGEYAAYERSISLAEDDIYFDEKNNRNLENFSINDLMKMAFDDLFIRFGFDPTKPYGSSYVAGDQDDEKKERNKYYLTHRIINIDTVYPVRKGREVPDPLYIRIESEISKNKDYSTRQVIINVNVSNMSETTDRPIVLIYEGPENISAERLPVILNLNANFRGILYAPNNPVVINGNGKDFEGFVVAEEYVQLADEKVAATDKEVDGLFVDEYGNVRYKTNRDGSYQTVQPTINPADDKKLNVDDGKTFAEQYSYLADQKFFDKKEFHLRNSRFDSFNLVKFDQWKHLNKWGSIDNLFTTDQLNDIN